MDTIYYIKELLEIKINLLNKWLNRGIKLRK